MGQYAELLGHNNILAPAEISDFAVYVHSDGGSISPEFSHNCVYSIGNGALTNQVYNAKAGEYYDLPGVVIEQDPQFREAPNGDFRPRNPNVLRGGKRDIADNATQMGAVLQKYQFARRAKAANLGRLQIVR